MTTEIVVVGAGGFAREVGQLLRDQATAGSPWNVLGYVDDNPELQGKTVGRLPVLGPVAWLKDNPHVAAANGIGSPAVIAKVATSLDLWGIEQPSLVHPRAWVGDEVEIGKGAIVTAGCSLTTDISVGRGVVLNLNSTVGHDANLGAFSVINPLTAISGGVDLGEGCLVGTGAKILQYLKVGEWSIVGAGAVVIKDLPANVTAVGNPANVIKQREPGWHQK